MGFVLKKKVKLSKAVLKDLTNEVSEINEYRLLLVNELLTIDPDRFNAAAEAVGLPRLRTKMHSYKGDVTFAMLAKVTKELAK